MPQLWQVVAGLSQWKPKFNPRLVNVGFVVTFQILEHELTMESIRLYSQSFTMQLDSLLVYDVQLLPARHLRCSSWFFIKPNHHNKGCSLCIRQCISTLMHFNNSNPYHIFTQPSHYYFLTQSPSSINFTFTNLHKKSCNQRFSYIDIVILGCEICRSSLQAETIHDTRELLPHIVAWLQRSVVNKIVITPLRILRVCEQQTIL